MKGAGALPGAARWQVRRRRLGIEPLEVRNLLAAELLGLGQGLAADYFSDPTMANLVATRIDPQVNFDWQAAAPLAGLPAEGFAVRWNGKLQAQFSEAYTFWATTAPDDGLRLTVSTADLTAAGGRQAHVLIDTWSAHTATEQSGTLPLVAGETYDVLVEYTNASGGASVALQWSSPSTPKATVPTGQLYPTQSLAVSSIGGNWLTTDVGEATPAGALTTQDQVDTIAGGGAGIGGASDHFQFAYQVLQGDGLSVVKVEDFANAAALNPAAQVGLLVRDGTAAGGLYAGLFVTPAGTIALSYRDTAGQAAVVASSTTVAGPVWLKLLRRGPTVNGYYSLTGADDSWTFVGRADVKGLGDAVLSGIAASSHNPAAAISAVLTNVSIGTDVQLAGGLGHLAQYYPMLPFIDLIKGGASIALRLDASGNLPAGNTAATLDAAGWPTEDFGYRGPYSQEPDALAGQTLQLTFTGRADVSFVNSMQGTATAASAATGDSEYVNGYNAATNGSKWYVRPSDATGATATSLSIRFRNTHRTDAAAAGTGLTNVQLLQPGYTSYDPQHVFTQEWLDLVRPLKEIRLKDWAMVDGNVTVDWSQRTLPATPNQIGLGGFNTPLGGVAWEYLVQFANLAHKDIWLSIPARVSTTYIQKLAQLIRYGSDGGEPYTSPQANPVFPGLAPDLNVYVEYSNEVWNGVFDSNAYAQSQAWSAYQNHTRYGPNQVTLDYDYRTWTSSNNQDLIYRWIAAKIKTDIVDTFVGVFGTSAINARIRPVLSGWMVYPDRTGEEGLKFVQAAGWAPQDSFYALSMAGYYGYNDLAAAQVTTNAARDTATKEEVLDTFADAATVERGSQVWPLAASIATRFGVKLVTYEAGPSLGATNAQGAAQMDPRFVGIQNSIVNSWFAAGGQQYNYSFIFFLNNYGNSQGDFQLSDNPWDRNQPRAQSLYELTTAQSTPPVIDGFTALPSGELEARDYVNDATPDLLYTVQPPIWQATTTYRYLVRSLVAQDLDLRISAASPNSGNRIQASVNGASALTYTYSTASPTDPAGYMRYADLPTAAIHLNAGLNTIDLVVDSIITAQTPKAAINSLKFTPRGAAPLANTLPWAFNLPGTPSNIPFTVYNLVEGAAPQTITVDVQDAETPAVAGQASPFTITATSDNPAILPNDVAHITLTYNASVTRWGLELRPIAGVTGTLNLTVTIADPQGARRTYVLPVNVIPPNPTAVSATAAPSGMVTLSWNNPSTANPTFKIERSTSLAGISGNNDWMQIATTGATANGAAAWTDNPPAGTGYYYRVTPVGAGGVAGNAVTANFVSGSTYNPVVVPSVGTVGQGLNATNLLTGKTYYATNVSSTSGGRIAAAAFDGTTQYLAFTAATGNAVAVTGLDGVSSIDALKFYFPSGVGAGQIGGVRLYYSTTDYTGASSTALIAANYTPLGSGSYNLYQLNGGPLLTQPDNVQVATLAGLAIPATARSLLVAFDATTYAPTLSEIQAFGGAVLGTTAPAALGFTTAWQQVDPASFANYVGANVTLSWSNPNGPAAATTFAVQRDTTAAFNSANLRTWYTPLNATSFFNDRENQNRAFNPYAPSWDTTNHNAPLPAGATYYYRVGTVQPDGSLAWIASPLTVVTAAATYPLAAPASIAATAVAGNRIDLSWPAVPGATGYKIEKSIRANFSDTNYALALVSGTTLSYADPTVTPGSTWYYRVRAVGNGGDSAWTMLANAATTPPNTSEPTNLRAEADGATIRLTWTPPAGKNYGYEIYRGTSPGSLTPYRSYTQGGSEIVWPAFADTGLAPNTTYYYAVRGLSWSASTVASQLQYTPSSALVSATTLPDVVLSPATIAGVYFFYNNSAFDGNNSAANAADDNAIAPDKTALLPGGTATFANYTSYVRGINGIIIDIGGLSAPMTSADFEFRTGNDNNPSAWAVATAPTISVRWGEGALLPDGITHADRITLTWEDYYVLQNGNWILNPNGIGQTWLQVTVKANANTGLNQNDVFYFGNAIGETGDSATSAAVNIVDFGGARDNPHNAFNRAAITDAYDFDRDQFVNIVDLGLVRDNGTNAFNDLNLITVPASPSPADAGQGGTTAAASGTDGSFSALLARAAAEQMAFTLVLRGDSAAGVTTVTVAGGGACAVSQGPTRLASLAAVGRAIEGTVLSSGPSTPMLDREYAKLSASFASTFSSFSADPSGNVGRSTAETPRSAASDLVGIASPTSFADECDLAGDGDEVPAQPNPPSAGWSRADRRANDLLALDAAYQSVDRWQEMLDDGALPEGLSWKRSLLKGRVVGLRARV